MTTRLTDALAAVPLIAVLRGLGPDDAVSLGCALAAGGFRAVEITMDSPDAATSIKGLVDALDASVVVGAGTVVSTHDVAAAVGAGAEFAIAPHLDEEVVRSALAHGIAVVPGVGSATELHRAVEAGATMVKLFPGAPLGVGYLAALRGPYPDVPIMVSGGVGIDSIGDWLRAGATAIGLGASTVSDQAAATQAVTAATNAT
ncbi:MAG: 2-dehydro-3-deoxyphosphogluconate aldolase / (4S)-4-hydroxy-2-oxoglutarate aldolase [Actinomycetota bacterium]